LKHQMHTTEQRGDMRQLADLQQQFAGWRRQLIRRRPR
jgi:hypothetical protein